MDTGISITEYLGAFHCVLKSFACFEILSMLHKMYRGIIQRDGGIVEALIVGHVGGGWRWLEDVYGVLSRVSPIGFAVKWEVIKVATINP